jgi:hypothetical protein
MPTKFNGHAHSLEMVKYENLILNETVECTVYLTDLQLQINDINWCFVYYGLGYNASQKSVFLLLAPWHKVHVFGTHDTEEMVWY